MPTAEPAVEHLRAGAVLGPAMLVTTPLAVLQALPLAVLAIDDAARVTLANAAAAARLGAAPEALVGRSVWEALPHPPAHPLREAVVRVAAGGGAESGAGYHVAAVEGGVVLVLSDDAPPVGRAAHVAQAALDATGDGAWELEVDTGRLHVDAGWGRLLDRGPGTLSAEAWRALVHPDDLAEVLALRDEHLAGRTPGYESEHRMRRGDGGWRWVLDRGRVAARGVDGRPLRMAGALTDVGARKLGESILVERTRQLELGMRAGRLTTWRWDLPADLAAAGASRAVRAPRGGALLDLVHPDDRARVRTAIDDALAGRAEYGVECRVVRPDGAVRWIVDRGDVIRDATGVPVAVIGVTRDVTEERQQADLVRASEARLRLALDAARMGTWEWDADTGAVSYSDTVGPLLGEAPGWAPTPDAFLALVPEEERARVRSAMFAPAAAGAPSVTEFRVTLRDGGVRHLVAHAVAEDEDGRAGARARVVGALSDATERVRLEEQLRQAQKMEAVGQLAGGVAHDFNNLLTVIGGNLGFVRADLPAEHPAQADLTEIARASDRARTLVRQLLAFSRKQVLSPRALDPNEVVRGAEKLLRRVIGEEIVLETALGRDVGIVLADAGQLDQVLLNLAVNARDAMLTARHGHPGTGGTLTLETGSATLDARAAAHWAPLPPGRYVRLTVRDTGHGMDQATRAHAFEPFFTTKPVGAGTGLGLATVYGIVAQSGGAVHIESAPGQGTAVTILLPESESLEAEGESHAAGGAPAAHGLVLLVEDEAAVRTTARRILERHGYAVLEARHGADALLLWRAHAAEVVAAVTDLRMPEMGGRELAAVLRDDRPDLPLVLVTGYADHQLVAHLGPGTVHVEKPFTGEALLAALRQVLAGPS
jgi:signal transduction histidine kinase/CheY-like chemotaxis protein